MPIIKASALAGVALGSLERKKSTTDFTPWSPRSMLSSTCRTSPLPCWANGGMTALTLPWNISFEWEHANFSTVSLLTDLVSLDWIELRSHSSSAISPFFQLSRRLSKHQSDLFASSDKKVSVRAGQIMQCWTLRKLTQVLFHQ